MAFNSLSGNVERDQLKGLSYFAIMVLGVSLAPVLIKTAINDAMDPMPLLSMRMLLAAIVLWVVIGIFYRQLIVIDLRGLAACFLAGATNAVSISCFYLSLQYIDASVATVLLTVHPVFVVLLLAFRGEPITRRKITRLALALTGIVLLVGPGGEVNLTGVLLVITTVIFFSIHLVSIQWFLHDYPRPQITVYITTIMAILLMAVYRVQYPDGYEFNEMGWLVIIVTAVVSTAIARFALFSAVQFIGSGQTALLAPVQTLTQVMLAAIFLNEYLSAIQVVGALLIIASAVMLNQRKSRKRALKTPSDAV